MKKFSILIVLVTLMTRCTAEVLISGVISEPAGFWLGIWHGIIAPITMIAQFFIDDVAMYAVNNTGGWYDIGFVMGIGGLSASSS